MTGALARIEARHLARSPLLWLSGSRWRWRS